MEENKKSVKRVENLKKNGVKIYHEMPKNWAIIGGAVHPVGFKWINNKKSRFNKDYKSALLKE